MISMLIDKCINEYRPTYSSTLTMYFFIWLAHTLVAFAFPFSPAKVSFLFMWTSMIVTSIY